MCFRIKSLTATPTGRVPEAMTVDFSHTDTETGTTPKNFPPKLMINTCRRGENKWNKPRVYVKFSFDYRLLSLDRQPRFFFHRILKKRANRRKYALQ